MSHFKERYLSMNFLHILTKTDTARVNKGWCMYVSVYGWFWGDADICAVHGTLRLTF